ncbi:MAG: Hpt domain-containing protein [Vicinamibacterales bacterium]|jgi:HPt (histidine-containing phosphotransfer) domain-containing protein|nr:Hpt domain-containing protein [Vicinamibacterales bacterium]
MDTQLNATATEGSPEQVDATGLMALFDGDVEMLSAVSEVFLEEYPSQLSAVRVAVQHRNAQALARSSHTLKGSVGIFGAEGAYEMACRLESFGRETQLAEADQTFADLERHVVRLGQILAALPCSAAA